MPAHPLSSSCSGKRWKHVRATLTPTFSAAKMRRMAAVMSDAVDTLVQVQSPANIGETCNATNVPLFCHLYNEVLMIFHFTVTVQSCCDRSCCLVIFLQTTFTLLFNSLFSTDFYPKQQQQWLLSLFFKGGPFPDSFSLFLSFLF